MLGSIDRAVKLSHLKRRPDNLNTINDVKCNNYPESFMEKLYVKEFTKYITSLLKLTVRNRK